MVWSTKKKKYPYNIQRELTVCMLGQILQFQTLLTEIVSTHKQSSRKDGHLPFSYLTRNFLLV